MRLVDYRLCKATFEGPTFRDRLSAFRWADSSGAEVRMVQVYAFGRQLLVAFG